MKKLKLKATLVKRADLYDPATNTQGEREAKLRRTYRGPSLKAKALATTGNHHSRPERDH